ncbi:uncharacterized protein LOC144101690 [Amblyomma americanum]
MASNRPAAAACPSSAPGKPPAPAALTSLIRKSTPSASDSSAGASRTARDSSTVSRPASTSPLAGTVDSGAAATQDSEPIGAKIRKLLEQQLPQQQPQQRPRSSSLPEATEHVAGLPPPRACYSTSCSGAETPVDYARTPTGLGSPRHDPKPVTRTLSYLDLAMPGAAPQDPADAAASVGGSPALPASRGSSVLTLARTWAHDLSSKKKAADAAESGVSPSTSAPSPPPPCTPAKVSVVVQLELMSDKPLVLRPLSTGADNPAARPEPSTSEQAAAFKSSSPLRRSDLQQPCVDTHSTASTAVGCLSQTTAPAGSSVPADRGSTPTEEEKATK